MNVRGQKSMAHTYTLRNNKQEGVNRFGHGTASFIIARRSARVSAASRTRTNWTCTACCNGYWLSVWPQKLKWALWMSNEKKLYAWLYSKKYIKIHTHSETDKAANRFLLTLVRSCRRQAQQLTGIGFQSVTVAKYLLHCVQIYCQPLSVIMTAENRTKN